MSDFHIVIPARYASTRLPGKPLADIAGKPMIWHVWQRALETGLPPQQVVIATDDQQVFDVAAAFGARVVMTSQEHQTGTDRLAEVAELLALDAQAIVVNLQGDEPLLPPELLTQVAENLATNPQAGIATLSCPIISRQQVFNPNVVKVTTDNSGLALYFSRAPIPWHRDSFAAGSGADGEGGELPLQGAWQRHIGLYAYRVSTLKAFSQWPAAPVETLESLEQLRAMWYGVRIHVESIPEAPAHGVDSPEDLERVRALMADA